MARFLTTTDISSQLEDIIKSARKYIVLISPYLQVNDRLREFLEEKDRFNRSLPDEGDDSNLIARVGGIFRPSKIDIHIVLR